MDDKKPVIQRDPHAEITASPGDLHAVMWPSTLQSRLCTPVSKIEYSTTTDGVK
jgi:hypothetical protein